jgi:hypothetical protein
MRIGWHGILAAKGIAVVFNKPKLMVATEL